MRQAMSVDNPLYGNPVRSRAQINNLGQNTRPFQPFVPAFPQQMTAHKVEHRPLMIV
jgi:hypothetical protein